MSVQHFLLTGLALIWIGLSQLAIVKDPPPRPPTPTPDHPRPSQALTPTPDRLAAPPTVENPTQADEGAQIFWLHCQPCHGDQGQGLTDEWRAQYPPDHQNCWTSGCHGNNPYENGFTLPTQVPPVIGGGSLSRFEHMGQVHDFIQSAMPYQDPGHLTDEEYLAITAFLARAHGVWDGTTLEEGNVQAVSLPGTEDATQVAGSRGSSGIQEVAGGVLLVTILGIVVLVGAWVWRQRSQA